LPTWERRKREMAFRIPTFNLAVSIWRTLGLGGLYISPDVSTRGNLTMGRRSFFGMASATGVGAPFFCAELLLPVGTDIRGSWNGVSPDAVEVPAGSGRFYSAVVVDDVAKGFPNEYRLALLHQEVGGNALFGPFPVPLP
jgi:hypothetical protein